MEVHKDEKMVRPRSIGIAAMCVWGGGIPLPICVFYGSTSIIYL